MGCCLYASIHRVNFDDGALKSNTEIINRDYRKQLRDKYDPFNKDMDDPKPAHWEYMDLGDFLEYNDKLILYKEVQITSTDIRGDRPNTHTGDGILTVYDKQLNIIAQQVIPKSLQFNGYEGINSPLHIHNNILTILSGNSKGLATIPLIIDYDLKENKITKFIRADRGNVKKLHTIDPASTLWFEKSFVVLYLDLKG